MARSANFVVFALEPLQCPRSLSPGPIPRAHKMLRRIVSGFAVAAALVLFALPAFAQQRVALVIGNAAYPKGAISTSLANGGLVAEALPHIGFDIVRSEERRVGE